MSGDIETNPGPVGHLTLEDLGEVIQALYDASAKWYRIGVQLKLSVGTLDAIRSEFSDTTDCLIGMCSHWLSCTDSCPSWTALTIALKSPHVGEGHLAQQLRDKYWGEGEEAISHMYTTPGPSPTTGASPTSQGSIGLFEVADEVEYFEDTFEDTFAVPVDKACQDVKKRELEPSILHSQVTTLQVPDHTQHRYFIEENLTQQSTSEQPTLSISPPIPATKFHPAFKRGASEEETVTTGMFTKLESPTPAEEYVEQKCVDSVTVPAKLLPSLEKYLSKAEVEADTSLPTKYRDYLSSTPTIRAAMCTPFSAKTSAEVFAWSQLTESPPPTTMTELFTTFTLKTLVGYLSMHPLYRKQQLKVTSFSDLPPDVYKQFMALCRMAYGGILNRQQQVFFATHLPTGFSPLGLMQEVPQVYTQGKASSYHFTHLTLQEFLSAVHISQLPKNEQAKLIRSHLDSGQFKMTMRFVAGVSKLTSIPPEVIRKLSHVNNLSLLHWLFECKDTSVTTRTLGSDERVVSSRNTLTPLDYYVTGHVISHSNCPWRLLFTSFSGDDEKFELFCQGCGGAGCEGYISYADFSYNDMTSKHMQSFVSIPPHILQGIRDLHLRGNKLDGSACNLLAKVVPSMPWLEDLWLSDNPIGSGGAVEVIKSLCGSGVKQLWLHNTGIGGPDCEALSKLLQSTHSLEVLHIDQNMSSESVASIITGLTHNSALRMLCISDSHFSMANTQHLSSLLRDQPKCTLTSLLLQDCRISSEITVELATALCKNTTLSRLDLSRNPIGEHVEGVAAVATLLIENKSLTLLELRDCHISGQGAGELAAALYKNSTLQILDLNFNPIGVEGASSMSDMLQHNTSLVWLYMCDDSVGEEGVHQLMNSVKHNQTLTKLTLPQKYKSETSDLRVHWW